MVVRLRSPRGADVTVSERQVERLKSMGYKPAESETPSPKRKPGRPRKTTK